MSFNPYAVADRNRRAQQQRLRKMREAHLQTFGVGYDFTAADGTECSGASVASGFTAEDARARFARENPHARNVRIYP